MEEKDFLKGLLDKTEDQFIETIKDMRFEDAKHKLEEYKGKALSSKECLKLKEWIDNDVNHKLEL